MQVLERTKKDGNEIENYCLVPESAQESRVSNESHEVQKDQERKRGFSFRHMLFQSIFSNCHFTLGKENIDFDDQN